MHSLKGVEFCRQVTYNKNSHPTGENLYVIRKATAREGWAIRKLIWQVGINPFGLNWRHFVVAVDEDDHLLGCGQIKPHTDGSLELASLAVQPHRQNQGIGRALIRRLLVEAPLPLYLMCRASLGRYYELFGFHTVGPDAMPASLRRIWRVFQLFLRIFPKKMENLLIMVKTA